MHRPNPTTPALRIVCRGVEGTQEEAQERKRLEGFLLPTHKCTLDHMCVHMNVQSHIHTAKKSLWKDSFFPTHSHTPTSHHVSALGNLLSPPSPEYDMALGLHLNCIHIVSLTVQDIWQRKSSSISNIRQMKITKGPHGDLLGGNSLRCRECLFVFELASFHC